MPSKIDTAEAMTAYINTASGWPSAYKLHVAELPVGWSLETAVLILPDGGIGREIALTEERFTFFCYGRTPIEARAVADKLYEVLHRKGPATVTVMAGTASIGPIQWAAGPNYIREPETEWPRWVCAADVTFSEWCL